MSRRFVPPPVAALGRGPEAEQAQLLVRARDEAYAEGRTAGFEAGRQAGYQEGLAAAREECEAAVEAARAEVAHSLATASLAEALERSHATRAVDLAALEAGMRFVLAAALRKLFPVLMARARAAELQQVIADTLAERAPERLTLHAHPDTLAAITALPDWPTLAPRLTTEAADQLAPGAAEIAWSGGGLAYDPEALIAGVTTLIDSFVPENDVAKNRKEDDA